MSEPILSYDVGGDDGRETVSIRANKGDNSDLHNVSRDLSPRSRLLLPSLVLGADFKIIAVCINVLSCKSLGFPI